MPKEQEAPQGEQDNVFDDNFDWGEPAEEQSEEAEETEEKDESKDESSDQKPEADKSAIIQKKRYRDLYKQSQDRIAELEKQVKGGEKLSAEEQKEKAAEEFISNKIRDVLSQIDAEKQQEKKQETEAFQAELEEVLDENDKITEEQILGVTEDLGVSPRQAVKVLERERKLTKRAKPKVPKETKTATKAESAGGGDKRKSSTLDDVNRRIKNMLGSGEL